MLAALGRLGDKDSTERLADTLTDDSYFVRQCVREALIGLGTPEAIMALRANKRRIPTRGWADVLRAKAAHRHRGRHPITRLDAELDRLALTPYGTSGRALIAGAALLAGATLLLGANVLIVAPITLVTAAWITALLRYTNQTTNRVDETLDIARARAKELQSARAVPAPITIARSATTRPLTTLSIVAIPLGIDALAGGIGIASGLVAGLMAAWIPAGIARGATIARWEQQSHKTILTEPARNPLPARRYFTVPKHQPSSAS